MKAALLSGPPTVATLMAQAHAMERESEQRYIEFAEIMEAHNNAEVAQLFRAIAQHENDHARQIRERMGWRVAPAAPPARHEAHVAELEQAHYLMQPWHVLQLALLAERRAHDFFESIATTCDDEEVREAAALLQAEEREHIALIESWLERIPVPLEGWDDDPDPPRYTD